MLLALDTGFELWEIISLLSKAQIKISFADTVIDPVSLEMTLKNALNKQHEEPVEFFIGLDIKGIKSLAIGIAAMSGNQKMLHYLLAKTIDFKAVNFDGNNLLHWAVIHGWSDLVRDFITAGIDHSLVNHEGSTPLILAAIYNRLDIIKYLISLKADIEAASPIYGSALCAAAMFQRLPIVEFLAEHKANLDATNRFGNSACHLVVVNAFSIDSSAPEPVINWFIRHGFKINSVNLQGNTLLHLAANSNPKHSKLACRLIQFLLSKEGVDLLARNHNGYTVPGIACIRENIEVIKLCNQAAEECSVLINISNGIPPRPLVYGIALCRSTVLNKEILQSAEQKLKFSEVTDNLSRAFPPLGKKYSRKGLGSEFSIIQTFDNKFFILLPRASSKGSSGQGFNKFKLAIDVSHQRLIAVWQVVPLGDIVYYDPSNVLNEFELAKEELIKRGVEEKEIGIIMLGGSLRSMPYYLPIFCKFRQKISAVRLCINKEAAGHKVVIAISGLTPNVVNYAVGPHSLLLENTLLPVDHKDDPIPTLPSIVKWRR